MADQDEKFLSRWSRRKAGGQAGEPEASAGEPAEPPPSEAPDEAEIVARLPDIESLDKDSDFSVFMKRGVPDALRRRALRKLWKINPAYSFLDGMNDYDEDFTIAASITEGIKTVYQVGKGMVREEEEESETEVLAEADPDTANDVEGAAAAQAPEDTAENEGCRNPVPDGPDREATVPAALTTQAEAPIQLLDTEGGDRQTEHSPTKAGGRSAAERRWGRFRS